MKNEVTFKKAKRSTISYFVFFMVMMVPALSSAQNRGKVEVIKDPLIDTLIARRPTLNRYNMITDEPSAGYRVQIYFGSSRQAAYSAQARFREDYPEYRTYITYNEPNFKVHAGDFRTRLEAQKLMNELTKVFTSMFVIAEKINPTKSDSSND